MRSNLYIFFILIILVLAFPDQVPGQEGEQAGTSSAMVYQTTVTGDLDTNLRQTLIAMSDTVSLQNRPPMTMAQLVRRIRSDTAEFSRALRSFGYYSPNISYAIDQDITPIRVTFTVNTGPAYLIREVSVVNICPVSQQRVAMPEPADLNLEPGQRIRSARVLEARQTIVRDMRAKGYPFPLVEISQVIIDHQDHSASISYAVDPGPSARFGDTEISGLSRVRPEYVLDRLTWEKGDPFKAPLMDDLRRSLTAGGLFSVVEVNHGHEILDEDFLPMQVVVTERKPRTVRAGLGYQTDIGPELKLGWTHRNLLGKGETLEFDLGLSDTLKSLEGSYTIPGFIRPDQNLRLKAGLVQEEQDAYDSKSLFTTAMLERILTNELSVAAGVGYRLARVEQLDKKSDLGLLFFPTDLTWDGRDDILDPGTGIRLNVRLIPFFDTLDTETRFLKTYASLNTYLELVPDKRVVLANRAAIGTINAESKSKVPPDERYYTGGGGSIRGYSYQSVGPLEDDNPVGGLSMAEINSELRLKMTRRSGLVAFLDGGRAYESTYPDFDERFYWGWGLGYRFYTDFGPIRADVAFPLNRRKGIDDSFQIYISLGQAF
ncbi:autotransporter assembly complex protein TamA [Desulfonatronovibrio hydrogenovorans]|uniref:autotransporter assembly complex protein TamA n=1 Tax=Desulfonatronovibrio hydrogenovorans TaxID=53245 RepID=UPI00048F913B|nr:autotransporter assembly complex family protein [Desulfonatronovibrio hydrogenovorans]